MKLFSAMCQIMQRSCNCVALYQKAQSMPEIAKQTLCDFFFTPFQSAIALLGLLGRDFAAKNMPLAYFFLQTSGVPVHRENSAISFLRLYADLLCCKAGRLAAQRPPCGKGRFPLQGAACRLKTPCVKGAVSAPR